MNKDRENILFLRCVNKIFLNRCSSCKVSNQVFVRLLLNFLGDNSCFWLKDGPLFLDGGGGGVGGGIGKLKWKARTAKKNRARSDHREKRARPFYYTGLVFYLETGSCLRKVLHKLLPTPQKIMHNLKGSNKFHAQIIFFFCGPSERNISLPTHFTTLSSNPTLVVFAPFADVLQLCTRMWANQQAFNQSVMGPIQQPMGYQAVFFN